MPHNEISRDRFPKLPRYRLVQTTIASLPTTILYSYSGIRDDKLAFEEWREFSCRTSLAELRGGTSPDGNRTYIGVDWPSDVNNIKQELREMGVSVKGLHGKLGLKVRSAALKDLDTYVEDADAFVVTSVAGIGTDQKSKYRAGFIQLRDGDNAPGQSRLHRTTSTPARQQATRPCRERVAWPLLGALEAVLGAGCVGPCWTPKRHQHQRKRW